MHKSASITSSSYAGRVLHACIRIEGVSRTSAPNRLYMAVEFHTGAHQQQYLDSDSPITQTTQQDLRTAVVALGVDSVAAELSALAVVVYQLLAGALLSERSQLPGAPKPTDKELFSLHSYYPFGLGQGSDDASTVVDLPAPPVDCPAAQQALVEKAVQPDPLILESFHSDAEPKRPVARWRAYGTMPLLLILAATASSMRADSSNDGSNLATSLRASSVAPTVFPPKSHMSPSAVAESAKSTAEHTSSPARLLPKSKFHGAPRAAVFPPLRLQ